MESMSTGCDLSVLDTRSVASRGALLELLHPVSGESLGISLRLLGADSLEYQRALHALTDAGLERLRRGRQVRAEDREQDAITLLAAITLGWSGMLEQGKAVEFSENEAYRIYRQYPWIREQANAFILDRANFLPA